MYKIYINDTPLFLVKNKEDVSNSQNDQNLLFGKYRFKKKFLLNYIDLLEKGGEFDAVVIYSDDYDRLVKDCFSFYEIIAAAGGVVHNTHDELLFIFRRGFWDLPKGKIEKDESTETAAIREVQEETGIQHIELGQLLTETYHTYFSTAGKRILKHSYWFEMYTKEEKLIPQTEEDIEKAVWIAKEKFLDKKSQVYQNILEVLAFVR